MLESFENKLKLVTPKKMRESDSLEDTWFKDDFTDPELNE